MILKTRGPIILETDTCSSDCYGVHCALLKQFSVSVST